MVQNKPKRPRGRPRAYDPDQALVRATETFWRAGFAATSLDDLSAATGMNRPSLYAAFGDKRDLYLAAIDRYVQVARADMAAALSDDVPLATGLGRVYAGALELYFASPEAPLGCFLIGTAATEAARDPEVRAKLGGGLRELTRAFEVRLRAARARGELAPERDPALLADLAGAVLHSIALRARAGDSRASLEAFAREAVRFLCGPPRRRRHARR
jgi:TetR/AcrR family transcriptional regulator, copper-responsive repressor